jgi:hypothetical protein
MPQKYGRYQDPESLILAGVKLTQAMRCQIGREVANARAIILARRFAGGMECHS